MTPEFAELRRLLDDVSARFGSPRRGGKTYAREALAAAAVNALPALLDAADERDALAAKVERVRALHFGEYVEDEDRNRCFECGDDWPCPTVRALDEEPQP